VTDADPPARTLTPAQAFDAALGLHRQGKLADAERLYQGVLALDRHHLGSLHNLGLICLQQGRLQQAASLLRRATDLAPSDAGAHNSLGAVYRAMGEGAAAIRHFEQAIALAPDLAAAHANLGAALQAEGRLAEAVAAHERALALDPGSADAATENDLGNLLQSLGRHGDAVARYESALTKQPDLAAARGNLANSLQALDRTDEAIAQYRQAIAAAPGNARFHGNLGTALRELGRIEAARLAFATAVALAPDDALGHLNLAEVKRFAAGDRQLAALDALAQSGSVAPALYFALGKARADLEDYAASFRHLMRANALRRREITYDEAAVLARFERIRAAFTPEVLDRLHGRGHPSEVPVFIIGMPRSGTTLVEQILASHPQVFGAGELTEFGDAVAASLAFPEAVPALDGETLRRLGRTYATGLGARAPAAQRITDKMPANFLFAGLIHLALPTARIVHVRRDPVDTCFSCFATLFTAGQDFAYDLGELARYYRAYDGLMAHWRRVLPQGAMLELRYEEIVGNLEGEARRLLAYCGLDWDERCLAFHATPRPVRTASAAEVREPIYRRSIGRAQRYGELLRPLRDALGT
jgi:tetratricopeptide (TPR) repeat protein